MQSKVDELIAKLSDDANKHRVSEPTNSLQSVPIEHLFAARALLFAQALDEFEQRITKIEFRMRES